MNKTVVDPKWNLERRASSGHLVWRRDESISRCKVRFRFDVEVREFEKHPHEDTDIDGNKDKIANISSTIAMYATCAAAIAVSVLLPWYLMEKVANI